MPRRSRKQASRPKTIPPKSPEAHEARETGPHEEGEPEGPPRPRMGTTADRPQADGKACADQERPKTHKRKCNADRGRWDRRGQATRPGPEEAEAESRETAAESSTEENGAQKVERRVPQRAAPTRPTRAPSVPRKV